MDFFSVFSHSVLISPRCPPRKMLNFISKTSTKWTHEEDAMELLLIGSLADSQQGKGLSPIQRVEMHFFGSSAFHHTMETFVAFNVVQWLEAWTQPKVSAIRCCWPLARELLDCNDFSVSTIRQVEDTI